MSRRIRSRVTRGLNSLSYVAKDLNYTSQPTYEAFALNAEIGEIGVFLVGSNRDEAKAVLKTTALAANDTFFIAQITAKKGTDERSIRKSPQHKFSEFVSITESPFNISVLQQTCIGYDGTSGDLEVSGIEKYDEFQVTVIENTQLYQPFPTWGYNYQAKSGDDKIDIFLNLAKNINNPLRLENKENGKIVSAEVIADGTYTVIGGTETLTVTKGSNIIVSSGTSHGLSTGDLLRVGGSLGGVYKVIGVSGAEITIETPYQGTSGTGIQGDTLSATQSVGLRLTALEEGVHFNVALKVLLSDTPVSYKIPFNKGSGVRDHIKNFEYEGDIFDGTTTVNAQFREKFGQQVSFRLVNAAYDVINFSYRKGEKSAAPPVGETVHYGYMDIASPLTSVPANELGYTQVTNSPRANLKTIFGF